VDPETVGGEEEDRILNQIVPELANLITPDGSILATPDRVVADTFFFRQMAHGIFIPDGMGGTVEVWSFDDSGPGGQVDVWPAPTIRVREGAMVHTMLTTRRGTHTIHHHGIEPTCMNDGAGHLSFEVDGGGYTYQWLAREAGTFFYHCHKNTVLHFEMGMYGMLIIDPPVSGAPFADGGPGQIRRGNSIVPYDIERLWVVDDIDRRWHDIVSQGVGAGVDCDFYHSDINGNLIPGALNNPMPFGPDPFMHQFTPTIFGITGIMTDQRLATPVIDATNDPAGIVRVVARRGQKILIRLLSGSYSRQVYTFPLNAQVIEIDGKTLGFGVRQQYSQPFTVAANTPFALTTARRWVLLIDTATVAPGVYPVNIDYFNWVGRQRIGKVQTTITVTA
jgi:FtsP/CotA-like multicopper oxidase with cupredoxin domain